MLPVTAVILAKNEQERISRCVESLGAFSQVLVLDSFSEDATLERVIRSWKNVGRDPKDLCLLCRKWQGFTEARNYSLQWVSQPWVLWIDSDEWIEKDLLIALKQFDWRDNKSADHYGIKRQSYFLGRPIRHGGWYPDIKSRLGRKDHIVWKTGPRGADVHEDLHSATDRPRGVMPGHLGHLPFMDEGEQRQTNLRYSTLLAHALFEDYQKSQRKAPSPLYIRIKQLVKFFENYLWKLGFLDGIAGLKIALGSCQSLGWRLKKLRSALKEGVFKV